MAPSKQRANIKSSVVEAALKSTNHIEVVWLSVIVILLWEGGVRAFEVSPVILPSPSYVVQIFVEQYELFLKHTYITMEAILVGFAVGLILGLVSGIIVFYSQFARLACYPLLTMIAITPKVAFAPLLVIWFGSGFVSKVSLAALVVFFPILVNTYTGLDDLNEDLIVLSKLYRTSEVFTFFKIRIPNALPYLLTGAKLGIVFSMIGTIVAEYVAGTDGIGYLIVDFSTHAQTPQAFGALLSMMVLSVMLYGVSLYIEKRLLFWYQG